MALPSTWVSAITGMTLLKGNNLKAPVFLPQSISILAEMNDANQSQPLTPVQITNAKQAATYYGYGSPMHLIARILFPQSGGACPIPVWCYPQVAAVGAAAKVITITPTGTATGAGTIYVMIDGREIVDGQAYAVPVAVGDTPTVICGKIRAAIAAVQACPVLGTGTSTAILTAKWSGLTSNEINVYIDLNGTSTGVTFAVANTTAGSGTPATTTALGLFGNNWRTIVINSYGLVAATITELENFNGVPDPTTPTGRYASTNFKPILAFSGTTLDDPSSITGASGRQNQVTICSCVAPDSLGLSFEAAANYAYVLANIMQSTPNLDIIGLTLPDMPGPAVGTIPAMNDVTVRQNMVLAGCSTAEYIGNSPTNGYYRVWDFVTTYAPTGELPPYYRWVRDLNIYFNYAYSYNSLQVTVFQGKTLIPDGTLVNIPNCITPSAASNDIAALNTAFEQIGLLVNTEENNKTIACQINSTNPDRLDNTVNTFQISGISRVVNGVFTGGFYFGN